jgi:hypothetical protein
VELGLRADESVEGTCELGFKTVDNWVHGRAILSQEQRYTGSNGGWDPVSVARDAGLQVDALAQSLSEMAIGDLFREKG